MKSAQKVNGISVSGPPKIGERPYPRQFHPVENGAKSREIRRLKPKPAINYRQGGQNSSKSPQTHQITALNPLREA